MFEKDFRFVGKHATYVKELVNKTKIFQRNIDVYMLGALIGITYNKKASKDTNSNDDTLIPVSVFINEKPTCTFIYRLVMLLSDIKDEEMNIENRLNRAFRDDVEENNESKMQDNMDLFHSYVLGGVEKIYELYTSDVTSKDEYLERMIELLEDFQSTNIIENDELNEETLYKYLKD